MLSFKFNNVRICSYGFEKPPHEVTSKELEDRLAPLYEKMGIPFGTLERLSGVGARRFFDKDDSPSIIATRAAETALKDLPFAREELGACFNCSVARDYFEPATGVVVHNNLGLSESAMAMDITNACVGFSNGMLMVANMIESGIIKAGLITSGENLGPITDATIERILHDDTLTRSEFMAMMATFTLGSGATAMVLCHEDLAPEGHKLMGSVSLSASKHNKLCMGNNDFCFHQNKENLNPLMETESRKLIANAALVGKELWTEGSGFFGWSNDDIDHIFCHQVGKHLGEDFYATMGLPFEKEHIVYPELGNLVSAALPSALFTYAEQGILSKNDKVLLLGFGSGLNGIFTALEW